MADDREMMARVQEGEQSALELLFARWEGPVFVCLSRLGCPPSWIEDLTEEVLVTLYRRRERYDPGRPFAPWLYGIARLVWKDHLRHRRREIARAAPLEAAHRVASSDFDPVEFAEAGEEEEAVRRAVDGLPEEQRLAFILRHYQGLSYEEIAAALEVPLGTAKWRIHEAVRRLEAALAGSQRRGG